jgi:hypothetical protein
MYVCDIIAIASTIKKQKALLAIVKSVFLTETDKTGRSYK